MLYSKHNIPENEVQWPLHFSVFDILGMYLLAISIVTELIAETFLVLFFVCNAVHNRCNKAKQEAKCPQHNQVLLNKTIAFHAYQENCLTKNRYIQVHML